MKKLDKENLDLVRENIEKLKEIFPDVFIEDKIDFEKLKENLGEFIEESDEKYQFTWFGKRKANKIALTPTNATLRPVKNESKNWDTTKNIYIEGDNLEVLKVLQKAYYKKIKMIYIDPPYNTGKDFIYKDNFKENLKNYLAMIGQIDEYGNKTTTDIDRYGGKHSNWLNMMYPRLKLARNLLRDDGAIFISIDDNEVHNLRKIMDEIFGEENFVGIFVKQSKVGGGSDSKHIAKEHEYVVIYSKNIEKLNDFFEGHSEDYLKRYKEKDENGSYFWDTLSRPGLKNPINYDINAPDGTIINGDWIWSKKRFKEEYKKGNVRIIKLNNGKYSVQFKQYLNEKGKKPRSMTTDFGGTILGKKDIAKLFQNEKIFSYPKSVFFIKKLIKYSTSKSDLILDFFSGSATTAHAVMELNAEDGGNRQFILVQLPEPTDTKSEAYKAGYKNICEIGKERIRRAGEKIKEDYKDKEWIDNLDIGFKVFKLDSTNIKEWDRNPDNLEKSLLDYGDFIKTGRSEEDLLYEVLLKYGIDLTAPIEEKEINGKKVYIVGFGSLIIYFDEIDIEIAKEIVNLVKEFESDFSVLVLKDNSFASSKDKVNIVEFFKQMNLFEKIITL